MRTLPARWIGGLTAAVLAGLVGLGPARGAGPAVSSSPPPVLAEAARVTGELFYDRAAAERLRAAAPGFAVGLPAAASADRIDGAIDAMLASLGASHTGRYTKDEVAYYELLDIFSRGDIRDRLGLMFPQGEVAYTGIGVAPRVIDGRTFLAGVYHGGPADRAGLQTGDEILAVDGRPFAPIGSFAGKAGRPSAVELRRDAGGPAATLAVTPERIRPNEAFLAAMRDSIRVIPVGGDRIGYVRLWSYAGWRYQELLEDELAQGRLKDADGLVLDLRGGWGGAQIEYAELFLGGTPDMVVTGREARDEFANFRWRRPLVVLIDGGTRSGKEIVAYALQRKGVRLVGTRTAGAVLAGRARLLGDDSLLLVAVLDVTVDGVRLEGRGVTPDVEVPQALPYAAGRDPQLEAALVEIGRVLEG